MASGDGWLLRLRTGARALERAELRALAELASAYGNGVIELTRRANLQLRGLLLERIPELRSELIALGLVDASPLREARSALLIDPVAALDRASAVVELGRALDEALAQSAAAHGSLSPKLGVVLDAGSGSAAGVAADVLFVVSGAVSRIRVFVDTQQRDQEYLGECERALAPALLRVLLAELAGFAAEPAARSGAPRMRDLLAARGIAAVRAAVASMLSASPRANEAPSAPLAMPGLAAQLSRAVLGFHAAEGGSWFGLAVPFGSASREQWLAIAELAERFGDAALRFTPAREVLLSGVRAEHAHALTQTARALGLIVDPHDLRRRIIACSGAPACSAAFGETRALASALGVQASSLLAAGATLHVSGCDKGCASRATTELNVVLAADGGARFARNADIAAASAAAIEPLATISARLGSLAANHERKDSRSM